MARKKKDDDKQKKVSAKIAVLRREGKTADQAAGEAYGMYDEGRLGKGGVYHRAGTKRIDRRVSRR